MSSKTVLLALIAVLLGVQYLYQPRWQGDGQHQTLSWDVSGYYSYLPAVFIYQDLKEAKFLDTIVERYRPTPVVMQAYTDEASGNRVMKYSLGQSISYLPGFLVAHAYASASPRYPPDGWSRPYQFMISFGAMLYMILGLVVLRKVLRNYFDETSTSLGLAAIVLGSNYLNYSAIDGAMTHNTVFTVYALLLYVTISYYRRATLWKGIAIGALVGYAALVRPTEIIALLIPILWGVDFTRTESVRERLNTLQANWTHLAAAAVVTAAIGSLQLFYWHYVTGNWFVYSYQEEGFSWLSPHIWRGLMSYRSGWLMYSPLMIFSLVGFYYLFGQNRKLFFPTVIFATLFMYIAWAWDIWWYGGSLGQRTMVQAYPVLAFPLCAMAAAWQRFPVIPKYVVLGIAILFGYMNLWFTHQAHHGRMLHVGEQTQEYYWATLLTWDAREENLPLLDEVPRAFPGAPGWVQTIYNDEDYERKLDAENQYAGIVNIDAGILPAEYEWFRVSVTVKVGPKEWDYWKQAQFFVKTLNGEEVVTDYHYRMWRVLHDNQVKRMHLDVRRPKDPITTIQVDFWNAGSARPMTLTDLRIDALYER